MSDPILKAGFDHPCRETCSGWRQGFERGALDVDNLKALLRSVAYLTRKGRLDLVMKKLEAGKHLFQGSPADILRREGSDVEN